MSSYSSSRNSRYSAEQCAAELRSEWATLVTIIFSPIFLATILALCCYSIIKRPKWTIYKKRTDRPATTTYAFALLFTTVTCVLEIPSIIVPACSPTTSTTATYFTLDINMAFTVLTVLTKICVGLLSYRVTLPYMSSSRGLRWTFFVLWLIFAGMSIASLGVYGAYFSQYRRYLYYFTRYTSRTASRYRPKLSTLVVRAMQITYTLLWAVYGFALGVLVLVRARAVRGTYGGVVVSAVWLRTASYAASVISIFFFMYEPLDGPGSYTGLLISQTVLYVAVTAFGLVALWLFGFAGTIVEYGAEKDLMHV